VEADLMTSTDRYEEAGRLLAAILRDLHLSGHLTPGLAEHGPAALRAVSEALRVLGVEPSLKRLGQQKPSVFDRADVRIALAQHDLQTVYRVLHRVGVSQRRIAAATGQSQSEISEIVGGRRVTSYSLLGRISTGLGIPRGRMGLSYDLETVELLEESGRTAL
jgi:hypothetical protein